MSGWEVFEVVWYIVIFTAIIGRFVYEAFIIPGRDHHDQG